VRRGRDGAAEELADISRVAEESLREVRDVVRGYRRTDLAGELAGARSVLRAAGVGCTVSGEDGGTALPEPVQVALGWVVREAVTNVLRHSRATECTVQLRTTGGEAELTVTNDGVAGPGSGWGSGLTGLAERLAVAGGRLAARRERDRFVLTATLPVGVPA
jgi:signal transduction histidine kinase